MDRRAEQKQIREAVERAYTLTLDDLEWRPYYPNNMLQCGLEGWYCVIQGPNGEFARKYTIKFQYPEAEDSAGYTGRNGKEVDRYILFERCYQDNDVRIEYPEPTKEVPDHGAMAWGVNDFGSFVYAHKTLEQAKKRALRNYQGVYGYAMSHILDPEEGTP